MMENITAILGLLGFIAMTVLCGVGINAAFDWSGARRRRKKKKRWPYELKIKFSGFSEVAFYFETSVEGDSFLRGFGEGCEMTIAHMIKGGILPETYGFTVEQDGGDVTLKRDGVDV